MRCKRVFLLLIFSVFTLSNFYSRTLHWVEDPGMAPNNWDENGHWSLSSGGGGGQPFPGSGDTAIFDAGSGSTPFSLNINTGAQVKNMEWRAGIVAGCNITGSAGLSVFGSLLLDPSMSANIAYSGIISFVKNAPIADIDTISTHNLLLGCDIVFANYNSVTYNVLTHLRTGGDIEIDVGDFGAVNFQNGMECSRLDMYSGALTYDVSTIVDDAYIGHGGTQTCPSNLTVNINTLSNFDDVELYYGDVNFNAGSHTIVNLESETTSCPYTNVLTLDNANLLFSVGRVDIAMPDWTISSLNNSSLSFFTGGGGGLTPPAFYVNGHTFEIVNVYGTFGLNVYSPVSSGGGTFRELNVRESSLCVIHDVMTIAEDVLNNPGSVNIYRNSELQSMPSVGGITFNGMTSFNSFSDCDGYAHIVRGSYTMDALTTIALDRCSFTGAKANGPSVPYTVTNSVAVAGLTNTGWDIQLITPTTYYWDYDATLVTPGDSSTYDTWFRSDNWTADPLRGPNFIDTSPGCVPSSVDAVVFKNNSYVKIDSNHAECHDMTWLGTGELYGNSYRLGYNFDPSYPVYNLDIYGSLEFSTQMAQRFYGRTNFKAYAPGQTVMTNGQTFKSHTIFIATDTTPSTPTASWELLDPLTVDYIESLDYTLRVNNGELNTNGHTIITHSFSVDDLDTWKPTANLDTSTIYILNSTSVGNVDGVRFDRSTTISGSTTVDADSAHVIFQPPLNTTNTNFARYSSFGHHLHKLTFSNLNSPTITGTTTGVTLRSDQIDTCVFENGGGISLNIQSGNSNYIHHLTTNTLYTDASFTITGTSNLNNRVLDIGTAIFGYNTDMSVIMNVDSLLSFAPGSVNNLEAETGRSSIITLLGPDILDLGGTSCVLPTIINDGTFYADAPNTPQNAIYVLLNNNTASGTATFNHTNGILTGTTNGWTGSPLPPRVLYWNDGDTRPVNPSNLSAGANYLWNDFSNWSLADGSMLDQAGGSSYIIGNCPPTTNDSVNFTDFSFSGPEVDTVLVDSLVTIASASSIFWNVVGSNPVLEGGRGRQFNIRNTLQLATPLTNNYLGSIVFIGGTGDTGYVYSAGKKIFGQMGFFAEDDTATTWIIGDELQVSVADSYLSSTHPANDPANFAVQLHAGKLDFNGQTARLDNFYASGTAFPKEVYLDNASLFLHTGQRMSTGNRDAAFAIDKNGNTLVDADDGSYIEIDLPINFGLTNDFGGFSGGGNNAYDTLIFNGTPGQAKVRQMGFSDGDTIQHLIVNGDHLEIGNVSGSTNDLGNNYYIHYLELNGNIPQSSLLIQGSHVFDTVIANNGVDFLEGGNTFRQHMYWAPANTYQFEGSEVQYFENSCDFNPRGTASANITWNSTSPPDTAYFRKDSGRVCTDNMYMKGIAAIGDGSSLAGAPCTSPNPALCDSFLLSSPLRRAYFFAGENAEDQGENFGWDFSPYPNEPNGVLTLDSTLCRGDSILVQTQLEGQAPLNLFFSLTGPSDTTLYSFIGLTPSSGSGTTPDPYLYDFYITPSHSGLFNFDEIYSERCFNNSAENVDSSIVTVKEIPEIGLAIGPSCENAPVDFTDQSTLSDSSAFHFINQWDWTFGDGGIGNATPVSHQYPDTGNYTISYRITSNHGCFKDTLVDLRVDEVPLPGFLAAAQCAGDSVGFINQSTGTGNTNYYWDIDNNGTVEVQDTITNFNYLFPSAGTYPVELVVVNIYGCTDSIVLPITMFPAPNASFSVADICEGQTTTFTDLSNGANVIGWAWDFDNTNSSTLQGPHSQNYTTAGSYNPQLIVESDDGCFDTIQIPLTVSPTPSLINVDAVDTSCANTPVLISGSTPTGDYVLVFNQAGDTLGFANYTVLLGNSDTSFYLQAIDTSGCSSGFDTVTIRVGDFYPPTINCQGQSITLPLDSNCQATVPDYTANVLAMDNCANASQLSITQSIPFGTPISNPIDTTMYLVANDGNGNTDTCSIEIIGVDVTPPTLLCPNDTSISIGPDCLLTIPDFTGLAVLDNCTGPNNITVTQTPLPGTEIVVEGTETIYLTATDAFNNSIQCSFIITAACLDSLDIPEFISPGNRDKQNDDFIIGGIENYDRVSLSVFNRWGNLVYEKNDYDNNDPWDGTYSQDRQSSGGRQLPSATYYIVVEPVYNGVSYEKIFRYVQIQN